LLPATYYYLFSSCYSKGPPNETTHQTTWGPLRIKYELVDVDITSPTNKVTARSAEVMHFLERLESEILNSTIGFWQRALQVRRFRGPGADGVPVGSRFWPDAYRDRCLEGRQMSAYSSAEREESAAREETAERERTQGAAFVDDVDLYLFVMVKVVAFFFGAGCCAEDSQPISIGSDGIVRGPFLDTRKPVHFFSIRVAITNFHTRRVSSPMLPTGDSMGRVSSAPHGSRESLPQAGAWKLQLESRKPKKYQNNTQREREIGRPPPKKNAPKGRRGGLQLAGDCDGVRGRVCHGPMRQTGVRDDHLLRADLERRGLGPNGGEEKLRKNSRASRWRFRRSVFQKALSRVGFLEPARFNPRRSELPGFRELSLRKRPPAAHILPRGNRSRGFLPGAHAAVNRDLGRGESPFLASGDGKHYGPGLGGRVARRKKLAY